MAELRKLAAILAVDVVGFSRLTGADEDRTLARLRALRSDLIDPTISVHNGRVVKRTGDGALVEFRSVVDAVRCAIEVQNSMQERNAGVPPDRQIEFRMGVHLGDVVEEGDGDLMGDGVNIASRLEGIATPGAICLSEDAYRQVKSRLDLSVSDMGQVQLKNIADLIKVYSLQVAAAAPPELLAQPTVVTVGASEKSSIAVLPFANMTGDPEQEYFVDGVVEDIITGLARYPDVAVVARNSTFIYKGQAVDVRKVAADLGVRYVLEGSARKGGNRLRITGQLIDASTGTHLWADRYEGSLDDAFDLQDRIVASIVGAVAPTLRNAEIEHALQKPDDELTAHDLYLRAQPGAIALRADENLVAIGYLDRAIALKPDYAPALAFAAWCRVQRFRRPTWAPAGPDDFGTAIALARRALAAGSDAVTMVVAGFSLVTLKVDYAAGLDAVRHAVDLNPLSSFVAAFAGSAMVWCEDYERGLTLLKQSVAFGPKEPGYYLSLSMVALAELLAGRPEAALEAGQRAVTLNPGSELGLWVLAAAQVKAGQMSEARATLAKFREIAPGATIGLLRNSLPIRNPETLEKILASLREAGLPD